MICCGTSGASPVDRFPFRSAYPPVKFSMKDTGLRIVAGRPSAAMCCSIRHLLTRFTGTFSSRCRSASATDVKTKCPMPAACAASATFTPQRTSSSAVKSGAVPGEPTVGWTLNRPQAPSAATVRASTSSIRARTTCAPACASAVA